MVKPVQTFGHGKRVLVTGSEGFVGRHLRRALELRGCTVIGWDKPGTKAEVAMDIGDPALPLKKIVQDLPKIDAVIYLAATITRGSSVDEQARRNLTVIADVPVQLLDILCEQYGSKDVPHFVYCSTYKLYGAEGEQLIDPEHPPYRPDPHSYGSAKCLAERLLAIAAKRWGVGISVIRPTCIFGPGQHRHNAIPRFLDAARTGQAPQVFGQGDSVRDDVYAPDLSWLLAEAALTRTPGSFHASGEQSRTISETAHLCCKAVAETKGESPLVPVFVPERAPKWWLDQRFDSTTSREKLGYEPTPMLQALQSELRWLDDGGNPENTIQFVDLESSK
jgi:UDP-glucose 4-epimerase